MSELLLVVVLLGTIAVVSAGIYFTFRAFREVDHPPVAVPPRHTKANPHDPATTAQLKHFFEGKSCAVCSRPVPPVHAGELRPGLLNASTHESIVWNDIPAANLSATLANHLPVCSNCLVLETFRRQHPDLVVDRHRIVEPSH
jgi:hypothetical protein